MGILTSVAAVALIIPGVAMAQTTGGTTAGGTTSSGSTTGGMNGGIVDRNRGSSEPTHQHERLDDIDRSAERVKGTRPRSGYDIW